MKWQEEEERGGDGSGGEGFGNPRIWPLSISTEYLTEYVHRSRISLPRYILLRRPPSVSGGGSPPMRWMNRPSNRLSGASLGFSRDGIDKRAVALIKRRCKTRPRLSPPFPASEPCLLSPPSYSLRHFFSGAHLERLPSPSLPSPSFFRRLRVSLAGNTSGNNISRPSARLLRPLTRRLPPSSFAASPRGIRFRDGVTKENASCGHGR